MQLDKRVCVINVRDIIEGEDTILAGERVMRVTRRYAQELLDTGVWQSTSKSKLKSFLNKNLKLTKNMHKIDTMQKISGDTYGEKRRTKRGKHQVYVEVATFAYQHEKGAYKDVKRTVNPVEKTIKHKVPKEYTQHIIPKLRDRDKEITITDKVKMPHLFIKKKGFKQRMVGTGVERRVVSFV